MAKDMRVKCLLNVTSVEKWFIRVFGIVYIYVRLFSVPHSPDIRLQHFMAQTQQLSTTYIMVCTEGGPKINFRDIAAINLLPLHSIIPCSCLQLHAVPHFQFPCVPLEHRTAYRSRFSVYIAFWLAYPCNLVLQNPSSSDLSREVLTKGSKYLLSCWKI